MKIQTPRLLVVALLFFALTGCSAQKTATPRASDDLRSDQKPASAMEKKETMRAAEKEAGMDLDKAMADEAPRGRYKAMAKKDAGGRKGSDVKTWKRSEIAPNTSRLMIGDKEELRLVAMQAKVRIVGFRARVLIDCYFHNEHARQFEGTFKLRLPDDASPYFFAFGETAYAAEDIPKGQMFYSLPDGEKMGMEPEQIMQDRQAQWKQPKEARMVPKEKAAFAYQETVRRSVDPALMEWSGAGIFSARVFPLAPKTVHRVVIGYDVNLLPAGDDLEYRFDIPDVPESMVDVSVRDLPNVTAEVDLKTSPYKAGDATVYRFTNRKKETVTVRLKNPGSVLLHGADGKVGAHFATMFRPPLPKKSDTTAAQKAVFLVDTSLSSNPDQFNVWRKLVEAVLANNRASIPEFAVLFFNIEQRWWRRAFVKNTPDATAELLSAMNALALEGATDIKSALAEAVSPAWLRRDDGAPWTLFLLSDGAITWGDGNAAALSRVLALKGRGRLFAYRTGLAGSDMGLLGQIARETGGAVFSVVGENEIAGASTAHRMSSWRLVGMTLEGGTDLLLAGRPVSVYPGQALLLAGRAAKEIPANARVVLSLRDAAGKRLQVAAPIRHAVRTELAARVYGQVAVGQLEEFADAVEKYSRAYATHYRITGNTCSLLMLESEAEYRRFNIKPDEDALVVAKNPAAPVIARVMQRIGDSLSNPKKGFLAWLAKMEKMPGVKFSVPTALSDFLKEMPDSSFAITPKPLACSVFRWEQLPLAVRGKIRNKDIEYDAFTAEANRRKAKHGAADALKAVSSLVEMSPGDGVLMRDVGFTAMQWGLGDHAYHLFRRVAEARPFEPHTYHALALLLSEMGRTDLAIAYYEVGLAGQWDSRFGDFRKILMLDYLNLLKKIRKGTARTIDREFAMARLKTLTKEIGISRADLMVTIMWNTDRTDVDLHVYEPSGEECYYSHKNTKIGGELTYDVTQGYGPEMYLLKKSVPGNFTVKVKYFASDSNRKSARTKVYATVYRYWGTKRETIEKKTVTLEYGKDMHDIATVKMAQ